MKQRIYRLVKGSQLLLLLLLLPGCVLAGQKLVLQYDSPARTWNEALPIGNGHLGAMVFGSVDEEILQLNDNTLYSGEPATLWKGTSITQTYEEVIKMLREGKYAEATDSVRKNWLGRLHQNYQPLGEWRIKSHSSGEVTNYRRALDISNAIQCITYRQDGVNYKREIFASFPDDVIVVRYSCDKKKALNVTVSMKSVHPSCSFRVVNHTVCMSGQAPGYAERRSLSQLEDWGVQDRHPEFFYADRNRRVDKRVLYGDEIGGMGTFFESRVKVIAPQAKIQSTNESITVADTDEILFVFSSATSYNGYNKSPSKEGTDAVQKVNRILKAISGKKYKEIKNDHIADYRNLFDRVLFEMPVEQGQVTSYTNYRIADYAQKQDNGLVVLLYQYGRYLMISGSRPGGQPLNLQGMWNKDVLPPWNGAYTMNINTEMNYWPAETTRLSECHEPLFRMIKELSVNGHETARLMYGCKGWVAHHNTSIWRETFPNDGTSHAAYWPMVGAWLCSHLWEHYLFTGDSTFLRDEAYPIMKSATEFFSDWLVDNGEGFLVTPVSTSPENEFRTTDGKRASVSMGCTMDMALIRELFSRAIEATDILNIDKEHSSFLGEKLNKLLPYRIGARGQLQEWQQDFMEIESQHRHLSHLYGLYPGNQIHHEYTPQLVKSILKTMEIRGDEATGWSMGWKINVWARLLDGNHANLIIKNLFTPVGFGSKQHKGGGLYANMLVAHPPFQIDGNFGYTSGVTEMLLQSHAGLIQLLPALPDSWPTGKIKGLKARGGFIVDMEWKDHKLLKAKITSTLGGMCRLRSEQPISIRGIRTNPAAGNNPNPFFSFIIPHGTQNFSEVPLKEWDAKNYYTIDFMTEKGKVYEVKGRK